MKKLILSITIVVCVMFSLTASASSNCIKDSHSKLNSYSQKEYKITGIDQNELTKFNENSNSKKESNSNNLGICFVYVSEPYVEQDMAGNYYICFDITIRCYGVPGNDLIIYPQE